MEGGSAGEGDSEASQAPEFLTREELLRRRLRRTKRLAAMYMNLYWDLIEELKKKHRDYYWRYGQSPFEDDEDREEDLERGEDVKDGFGGSGDGGNWKGTTRKKCKFSGCKSFAMPLTAFCHTHILSDGKQTLYKPCLFRSANAGQGVCKPVLKSTNPSCCPTHLQRVQKRVSQALKKVGIGAPSSSKPALKFPAIIAESVRQIQDKRKKELNAKDVKIS